MNPEQAHQRQGLEASEPAPGVSLFSLNKLSSLLCLVSSADHDWT
jgi:hypothetical protein